MTVLETRPRIAKITQVSRFKCRDREMVPWLEGAEGQNGDRSHTFLYFSSIPLVIIIVSVQFVPLCLKPDFSDI